MDRREAICEGEKYQGTDIGGKRKWDSGVYRLSGMGDELRKQRRDDEKKSCT
jgi:hypothetical protein